MGPFKLLLFLIFLLFGKVFILCHDVDGEILEDDTPDASDYPDSADPGGQYDEHDEFSGNEMDFENFTYTI